MVIYHEIHEITLILTVFTDFNANITDFSVLIPCTNHVFITEFTLILSVYQ